MTNWSCCFGRCEGSETASKSQQSMTHATGTCGQGGHAVQPGAGGHVIRRSLHEDLIQSCMAGPSHWIFQAVPFQADIARTGIVRRGGRRKGAAKQSGIHTIKSVVQTLYFPCKLLTPLYQPRERTQQRFLLIRRFPQQRSSVFNFPATPELIQWLGGARRAH